MIEEVYYLVRDIIDLAEYIEKVKNEKWDDAIFTVISINKKAILERAKRIWNLPEMKNFRDEHIQGMMEYVEQDYKEDSWERNYKNIPYKKERRDELGRVGRKRSAKLRTMQEVERVGISSNDGRVVLDRK